jgi:NADH-quinone oxidoreductase subunit G
VIAFDSVLTETALEHADVVFPAEAYPEKEGTLTHPDGRLQRLRPAIGHPRGPGGMPGSGVRPLWQVIADVAKRLGHDPGDFRTGFQVSARLFDAVPFYNGLTLEDIGGRGIRWPERATYDNPAWELAKLDPPAALPAAAEGKVRLGTYRPLWAAKDVDISPALHFVRARQVAELSPADAAALGINEGDRVAVGNGTRVNAIVRLRDAVPAGTVFLAEGVREDNANVLRSGELVDVHRVGAGAVEPSAIGVQMQPAVEGLAEMPQSAPLPIPPREVT